MNTFDRLMDLTRRRLVQARFTDDRKLVLFKYHRRVFYDGLWGEDPALLMARGHVYEVETKKLILNPFDKVFNYGERGAGMLIEPDKQVIIERKINGFMAACTWYQDRLLVTSSGSFESPFVDLARKHLDKPAVRNVAFWLTGHTLLFEIVDPSDPHVIPEVEGAWWIGHRKNEEGSPMDGVACDRLEQLGSPATWHVPEKALVSFEVALMISRGASHEGFMIKDPKDFRYICKVKSKKYLGLKLMARAKRLFEPGKTSHQLKQTMEEEFFPIIDFIFDEYGQDKFLALPEQEKLSLLRERL